ncbi:MAG: molecular chaperone DnaK, partial [Anaerolineae bacterium]|nr:molecular chaperone DnaK [Anaerolineae bacterium]
LAYQTEKTLKDLGDKVPAGERENISGQVKALRQAIEGDDAAKIKSLSEALQNAFHALSQQLYAQDQAAPQDNFPNYGGNGTAPNGSGHSPEDEGEVIEGEFTEA